MVYTVPNTNEEGREMGNGMTDTWGRLKIGEAMGMDFRTPSVATDEEGAGALALGAVEAIRQMDSELPSLPYWAQTDAVAEAVAGARAEAICSIEDAAESLGADMDALRDAWEAYDEACDEEARGGRA